MSELTTHRIAKFMARTGVASRRDCEKLILEGRVTVNGERVESPALNILETDEILLDGNKLAKPPLRVWLYHKPQGLVTTSRDERDRKTIFDELSPVLRNVNTVGRLDLNSEGLLLLTNDGELKRKLELPDTGWRRKYRVRAYGKATEEQLETLRKGVVIDGEIFRPMEITLDREKTDNRWYTVALREGKNREIRRAFETIGITVNRLIRTSYGPFQLGAMEKGEVTELRARALTTLLGGLMPEGAVLADAPLDLQTSYDEREVARAGKREEREELMKKQKAKGKGGKRDDKGGERGGDRKGPPRDRSDDRPKRAFGDKPRGDFKGGDFKDRGDDRPKRSFGDKPRGDFTPRDGERRPFKPREDGDRKFTPRGDGPKRDFKDRDERPKRDFGDKPRGDFKPRGDGERRPFKPRDGERPARAYDDKPKRSFGDKPRGDFKPRDGDRKDFKPRGDGERTVFKPREDGDRKFTPRGDGPKRDFKPRDGDGPKRSYDDRPKRDFGDKPKRSFDDKPKRDFKPRDGDGPKRSFEDKPKRDFKPRDGEKPKRDFGNQPKADIKRRDEPPKPDRFKRDVEKRAAKRDENVGNQASGKKVSPFFKKPASEE